MRLLAVTVVRDEMRYLPGFLENVAPKVDGIVALDDASTDGSAEVLERHPSVLEVVRVRPDERLGYDEARLVRRLVEVAARHRPEWLLSIDADERIERDFRRRCETVIARGARRGLTAYAVAVRELWDAPDLYRADGIWGRKCHARLWRWRNDHEFDDRPVHTVKPPLQARLDGQWPFADLELYHLRMLHRADRGPRRAKFEQLDPDARHQRLGYAYLTDEAGLELASVPPERDWRGPPTEGRSLPARARGPARRAVDAVATRFGLAVVEASPAGLCELGERLDHDVVERTIYSPVPDVRPEHAAAARQPAGFELDTGAQLEWVEADLGALLAEFGSGVAASDVWNGWYQGEDAALLHAMLRRLRPRRVLEIGSGHSTRFAVRACRSNATEGVAADFVSVDPRPRVSLPEDVRHERRSALELPLEQFLELDVDDVLFVDTTHVVKRGSEVNRLILDVLPRLREGVVVHFHDIFLPHDYPRSWHERGLHLNEQYLLEAFLAGNARYEVLVAAHALARAEPDRLHALMQLPERPAERSAVGPTAFWMRRVSGAPR